MDLPNGPLRASIKNQNYQADIHQKHYTAPCFIPRNFGISHEKEQTIKKLKSTILRLEAFNGIKMVEIFCG